MGDVMKLKALLWALVLGGVVPLWPQHVQAQDDPAGRKRACTCLTERGASTGISVCGKNEYLVGPDDPPSSDTNARGGAAVPVQGCCCPLPADDILTEVNFYGVDYECPPDSVVTGSSAPFCSRNCIVRCTKINTEKYSLGVKKKGNYWYRRGFVQMGGWGGAETIYWEDIPVALRYAHGRSGIDGWDGDGCAAEPIGAFLVAKTGARCDGFEYRELLTRSGLSVATYADCATDIDPKALNPFCELK